MADLTPFLQGVTPPAPEYQRGSGANSLAYGEASQLNQAAAAVPSPQGTQAAPSSPASPPPQVPFKPGADAESQYLFAPTTNLNEPVGTGQLSYGRVAIPEGVLNWLPLLGQVAHGPEASPALQALYQRWVFELGRTA